MNTQCQRYPPLVDLTEILHENETRDSIIIPADPMYEGCSINRVFCTKFLGLYMDDTLSWDIHINTLVEKLAPTIGVLYRLNTVFNDIAKRCLYFGLIHSKLSYMIPIWGAATRSRLEILCVLQRRAIKHLFGFPRLYPSDLLFQEVQLLTLENLHKYSCIILVHQVIKGLNWCNTDFVSNTTVCNYGTRLKNKLHIPKCNTTKYGIRSVYNILVKFYNEIPQNIILATNINIFKRKLKKYIISPN